MPRIPADLQRGTLAEQAALQGRSFTAGLRRDKASQLKMFQANLRAARAGPPPKKYVPPPESSDMVTRILKANIGKVLTPKKATEIEKWHTREIAKAMKSHG
jgi:hypothetical protein